MASKTDDGRSLTRSRRLLFVVTIFTGSFLLFLVQPMIARMALPRLGGAPSVWNSAMLVYQALLLGGYAYAHWLGHLSHRRQAGLHILLFAAAGLMLPIGLAAAYPTPESNPFLWVPWLLLTSIGPLFLVVSAQAPLLQRWFAASGGGDPYPLYASSNLGSFAGLISYPLIFEPLLPLTAQRYLWSAAFVLLALLVACCAFALSRHRSPTQAHAPESAGRTPWRDVALWVVLAAVPSGLILSTTLHLTTDIVAMPLLWVGPLSVYLLSFTIAFSARRTAADAIGRLAPIILLIAACGLFLNVKNFDLAFAGIMVLNLFTLSVSLHSRLFEQRPPPAKLTLFYLAMSVGGALGGLFAALVAPLVFDWTYEHLILLLAAAVLMGSKSLFVRIADLWDGGTTAKRVTIGGAIAVAIIALAGKGLFGLPESRPVTYYGSLAILAIAIVAIGNRWLFTASVAALIMAVGGWEQLARSASPGKLTRSFFGVYGIETEADGTSRSLAHGTTLHGVQNLGSPDRERMPTTYYAPESGVGLAAAAIPQMFGPKASVGVIGLGTGTLACYARPDQAWTFYEIDPVVADIARDPRRFTFLSRCLPSPPIVIGDARLSLERAKPGIADLLIVDAFSSDSIPMHLLTKEAFTSYRRHLKPNGLLLVHISNRYLELEPVIAAVASPGWYTTRRTYSVAPRDMGKNYTGSTWIALSPDEATLTKLEALGPDKWQRLETNPRARAWTDDYASLLPLIKWRN